MYRINSMVAKDPNILDPTFRVNDNNQIGSQLEVHIYYKAHYSKTATYTLRVI